MLCLPIVAVVARSCCRRYLVLHYSYTLTLQATLRAKLKRKTAIKSGLKEKMKANQAASNDGAEGGAEPDVLDAALQKPKYPYNVGDIVLGLYEDDGEWYKAEILEHKEDGVCRVMFVDYEKQQDCAPDLLKPKPRASLQLARLGAIKAMGNLKAPGVVSGLVSWMRFVVTAVVVLVGIYCA